ncbi:hypothetical protein [Alcaligenes faecalis]|uniref:hypothetical protein n=1 Tax=Alcaligenes faecalis TaxID=511 RepID=UPI00214FDAA8|nr:hypothetical protein [Alcaligenes faecalis]MCR4146237.1 hypothetical protein [Alcaligenes faecalis]
MSDIMLNAVIQMPYEMAMKDKLSRRQFYERANQALNERNAKTAEIERLHEAITDYLQTQDAVDNNEYQSMPEDFGKLNGRRKAARNDLDAALSGEPT